MKSFLIIGLGRFGRHMAKTLVEQKNEVLAIDIDEHRVNDSMRYVSNVQIGNATNEQFISSLGVGNFDVCVVAIGDNFQASLEATSLLKECGARFVLARASRDVHKKFLLRNGADEVVYAERELAERLAVKHGSNRVFDYIKLADDYAIYEYPYRNPGWEKPSWARRSGRSTRSVSLPPRKTATFIRCPLRIMCSNRTKP